MKWTKFIEEQLAFALRQTETDTSVEEVCRQMGISQATFFNWKKQYGGLGVLELRRLLQLEEENAQLKKSCKAAKDARAGRVSPGCLPGIVASSLQNPAVAVN
jgi:putative transposase